MSYLSVDLVNFIAIIYLVSHLCVHCTMLGDVEGQSSAASATGS